MVTSKIFILFCISLVTATALAGTKRRVVYDVDWTTQQVAHFAPRPLLTVNDTWPPPPLIVNAGDEISVTVNNKMKNKTTSIHHHGIWFRNNNANDGVSGISQCGIPAGDSFTYNFRTSPQTGSFWYHSHTGGQYTDGLKAPLIIKDAHPHPDVKIDDELILVVSDWYNATFNNDITLEHNLAKNPWGPAEPHPDGAIIYALDANGKQLPGYNDGLSLPFGPGKTYRIRLIQTGTFPDFMIWLDNHEMQVIELDGVPYKPATLDHISLTTGQRVSIVVRSKPSATQNFLMHFNMNPNVFKQSPHPSLLNHTINVVYDQNAPFAPATSRAEYKYIEQSFASRMIPLHPKLQIPAGQSVLLKNELVAGFEQVNSYQYQVPQTPVLLEASAGNNDTFARGTYPVDPFKGIHIRILNADITPHAFHLHGQVFQILGFKVGVNASNSDWKNDPLPSYNSTHFLMRRDTVALQGSTYADLMFFSDNPGAWFFHCHMAWHLADGLAAVILVDSKHMQDTVSIPSKTYDQCHALGVDVKSSRRVARNYLLKR